MKTTEKICFLQFPHQGNVDEHKIYCMMMVAMEKLLIIMTMQMML